MFLDDFELRTIIALGLRLIATDRVPMDEGAYESYVHELAARASATLRAQGLRTVPAFPGNPLPQPVAAGGARRSVFAADVWRDNELVGTAITSLIRGRLPNISVAPPTAPQSRAPRE
jgi:hypothetical protein